MINKFCFTLKYLSCWPYRIGIGGFWELCARYNGMPLAVSLRSYGVEYHPPSTMIDTRAIDTMTLATISDFREYLGHNAKNYKNSSHL